MPGQLENVTVGDNFTDATTVLFQLPTYKVNVIIANQPVAVQFLRVEPGMRTSAGVWDETIFMVTGAGPIPRPYLIGGVRFKNWDPNSSQADAQVSCHAS